MSNPDIAVKFKRTFVRDQAYQLLRNWIIDGTLQPEQKLRDKELAEQLGVSRTPIREALLRLEDEGLIQTKPNSATIVAPIDVDQIYDLYSIIWTLETLAIQQSNLNLDDTRLQTMQTINKELKQALDTGDYRLAVLKDEAFHAMLTELCPNQELRSILANLKQKVKRIELVYFHRVDDVHLSGDEHDQILSALKQQDLTRLQTAIEHNWRQSFSRLQRFITTI